MKTVWMLWVMVGLVGGAVAPVQAGVREVRLLPARVAVLPMNPEEPEVTTVALGYEMPELPRVRTLGMVEACLVWEAPFVTSGGEYEFTVHRVTRLWNAAAVEGGRSTVEYDAQALGYWSIEGSDYERHGGMVRVPLTDLAVGWLQRSRSNLGIVIRVVSPGRVLRARDFSTAFLEIGYLARE